MRQNLSEVVVFRGPPGFLAAVHRAARREHTSAAEFLRRTAIEKLKDAGIALPPSGEPAEEARQ